MFESMVQPCLFLASLLLVTAPASSGATTSSADGAVLWFVGSTSDDVRTLDAVEPRLTRRLGRGRWRFEVPLSTMLPVVEQRAGNRRVAVYNFRALATLSAFGVNARLHARDDEWLVPLAGPAALLYLPNWDLGFEMTPGLRAKFGVRTDLIAARPHRGERGASILPHLGLVWAGQSDSPALENRLFVECGPSFWWSFEGKSRGTDLRIAAGFAVFVFR